MEWPLILAPRRRSTCHPSRSPQDRWLAKCRRSKRSKMSSGLSATNAPGSRPDDSSGSASRPINRHPQGGGDRGAGRGEQHAAEERPRPSPARTREEGSERRQDRFHFRRWSKHPESSLLQTRLVLQPLHPTHTCFQIGYKARDCKSQTFATLDGLCSLWLRRESVRFTRRDV